MYYLYHTSNVLARKFVGQDVFNLKILIEFKDINYADIFIDMKTYAYNFSARYILCRNKNHVSCY